MKKNSTLILLLMLITIYSSAQQSFYELPQAMKSKMATRDFNVSQKKHYTNGTKKESNVYTHSTIAASAAPLGTQIGQTQYDLLSNNSIGRRIIKKLDGTIAACWNFSPDGNTGFPNRGTGYNYYNGTTWLPEPTIRIESVRTGFPDMCLNTTGGERIFSHGAISKNIYGINSTTWGSNTWVQQDYDSICVNNSDIEYSIWNRVAASGNNIYVLNNCFNGSTAAVPVENYKHPGSGVLDPTYYSRSTDGGLTFVNDHITLTGYDSTRYYLGGGGEAYAIEAKDSIVAILMGGLGRDVAIWKSIDYGVSFTKTILDSFPIAAFKDQVFPDNNSDGSMDDSNSDGLFNSLDAVFVNNGSLAIAIDNNNKIHCSWTLALAFNDSLTTDTLNYGYCATFPTGGGGLVYWSETAPLTQIITGLGDYDTCMVDSVYFGSTYFSNVTTVKDAYYGEGPIAWPTFGFDASGNIYLAYSVVTHDTTDSPLISELDGQNFRDLFAMYSADNGASWSSPVNLTKTWQIEEAYPSLARNVDANLTFSYMEDIEPGNNLTSGDDIGFNFIKVHNYNTVEFRAHADAGDDLCLIEPSAITEYNDAMTQLWPNPASSSIALISTDNIALDAIEVRNNVGQLLAVDTPKAATNSVQINTTHLCNGVYFLTYTKNQMRFAKKFIVQH